WRYVVSSNLPLPGAMLEFAGYRDFELVQQECFLGLLLRKLPPHFGHQFHFLEHNDLVDTWRTAATAAPTKAVMLFTDCMAES
ncbi:hypothetical protein, partial [Undibacterium luofuense]